MIVALLMSQSLLADGLTLANRTPECTWDASLEMSRLMTADRKGNEHFDREKWEENLLALANAYLKAGCVDQSDTTFSMVKDLTGSSHIREKAEGGLKRTLARLAPVRSRRAQVTSVESE
jgi:hypothetical protein